MPCRGSQAARMKRRRGVVIVGGSIAGATAADALIDAGYDGQITLIGDEPYPAYARPPLSKEILAGSVADDSIVISTKSHADLTVRTHSAAVGLDTRDRAVVVTGGDRIPFDRLVIATGTRARQLGDAPGQIVVRTLDDAIALRTAMTGAESVLVVGGGFLAMEVASAAHDRGLRVTVLSSRTPLQGALGEFLADLVVATARRQGVTVTTSPAVTLCHNGTRPTGAITADGNTYEADIVVTAIGDIPNTEWLTGSGVALTKDGWVAVDPYCRATISGVDSGTVVAAGDVAATVTDGIVTRMPHWENAIGQARAATRTLLDGAMKPYRPEPFFWTSAFGLAIKIAGTLPTQGNPQVLKGCIQDHSALLRWSTEHHTVIAAVNHRIPVARLKRMAASDAQTMSTSTP
jgi:3-phenylpropionate/trans-cinnamate dioxygenase ferredoxin reductase subunit